MDELGCGGLIAIVAGLALVGFMLDVNMFLRAQRRANEDLLEKLEEIRALLQEWGK